MSRQAAITPLTLAVGTLFTVSLANITVAGASENPFAITPAPVERLMLAEGKCGEGKCGGGKASAGKCGMGRMDADSDGNVTRDEFMQGHAVMFDKIDKNGDGVIDPAERAAHMEKMKGFMMDGKCGGGKCGSSK